MSSQSDRDTVGDTDTVLCLSTKLIAPQGFKTYSINYEKGVNRESGGVLYVRNYFDNLWVCNIAVDKLWNIVFESLWKVYFRNMKQEDNV